MVWTRDVVRTALIVLVMTTILADQSDAEIQTVWFPVFNPERGGQVDVLVSDGDRLYASPDRGLVFSDDNGITWHPTGFKDYVTAIAVHGNTIYVGAHRARGIFRSDDRGETWKPINHGLRLLEDSEGRSIYGFVHQILVTRSGTVIAVLNRGATYKSDDRGERWEDLALEWDEPPFDPFVRSYHFSYSDSRLMEFDRYLWAWRTTIGRSSDNGRTWEFAAGRYHPFNGIDAWVVHNDQLYLAGGVYRTGPGVGVPAKTPYFARFDDEFRRPLVQGLPLHPKYDPYVDLLPKHVSDAGFALIRTLASHRGRIFAGMWGFGVYVFNDRSETWSPAGLNGLIVFSLVVHQSDLYAATDQGIYRAAIRAVIPHGKSHTTWSAVKQR